MTQEDKSMKSSYTNQSEECPKEHLRLAAVPTQRLSSRSIISLDPRQLGVGCSSSSIPISHFPNKQQNQLHKNVQFNNSSRQVLNRNLTSNSLARDSTWAAKQQLNEWKQVTDLKLTNVPQSKFIKSSCGKRNFDEFQSSHSFVNGLGEKMVPSPSHSDQDVSSICQEQQCALNIFHQHSHSNINLCNS
jgi:hypothetical protein